MLSLAQTLGQTSAVESTARDTGVSAIWILANLSFAGMRAQGHPSVAWRFVSFVFGFPGTILTFFVVREGGERAYGVHLPLHPESPAGGATELRFVERDR
jgi:hypothetical protein